MTNPDQAQELAGHAAGEWLTHAEKGDAAETWARSSTTFREALSQEAWAASLKAAQAGMGRPLERTVATSEYVEEIPGAPDGQYVVFTYTTRFERKKNGTETVVVEVDTDGEWRVSGYFVR